MGVRTASVRQTVRAVPAVRVARLGKSFRIPHRRSLTIRERLVDRFRPTSYDVLQALDDVSFDIRPGEFFGIVGRNGSGKSTLLKCVAGIYDADEGAALADGRLAPFVELGVGFNPELTGRENVYAAAVLLGLTRPEARRRIDAVLEFAELDAFGDLQLKNYSSGMVVRLSFATAVQVDADILLIDEVLAVGDAAFRQKCFEEFDRLKAAGRTIVFVTHDMRAIERFCDRALLLEQGRVVALGAPEEVARSYAKVNADSRGLVIPPADPDRVHPPEPEPPSPASALRRYRPSALGSDARRLVDVTRTLAAIEFQLHYLGSVLGYAWAVMRPLMLFGVTYFVFTHVGAFGEGVRDYGVYLLTSIVLWTFFAEATSGAATCLLANQDLLRRLRFPRIAIPLSVVANATVNLAVNLVAVAVLVAAAGVSPRLTWLELPLLVALLMVLASGVALLLSALYVRFRDVAQIWTVALQLLFFASAVLYVVTQFPHDLQRVAIANPLAMIFTQMRHALIDPHAPTAADVAGGTPMLAVPLAIVAVVWAVGFWVFRRESPRMAENL